MKPLAPPDPQGAFALLDESTAALHNPHAAASRCYSGHVRRHRCAHPDQLDATWAAVRQDLAAGLHAVLLADYEWGVRLQGLPAVQGVQEAPAHAQVGGLQVLMFRHLQHLDEAGVQAFLGAADVGDDVDADPGDDAPTPAGVLDLQPDDDDETFAAAIGAIQAAIRAGEVYQINHTYRLTGRAWGSPAALYRRLRARQRVGFGAFIALPPDPAAPGAPTHVLSASPELFLRQQGGVVSAKPMKGTAPRGATPQDDEAIAQALQRDVKNRAENLMIVDLLRNDLGRIAVTGGVQVPALFEIEAYATLFQMTSTVQARLRPEVDLPALLRATFPCGSITGAPKRAAMARIQTLETQARGLYCGAIGWLDAPPADSAAGQAPAALGDFCLNVAIRTLTLGPPAADGLRPLYTGVGAGIVLDSVAADEAQECRLKARFLTGLDTGALNPASGPCG